MKKTFLFLFAAVFAASVNAQFVVDASGNAAVGYDYEVYEDPVLSDFAVNSVGFSSATAYIKSEKRYGLYINENTTSANRFGVYSSTEPKPSGQSCAVFGKAIATSQLTTGSACGLYGIAGYGKTGFNYGVFGTLFGTGFNGAAIFGTTHESDTIGYYLSGRYAGYFRGNVYVTGTVNGMNISSSDYRLKENIENLPSNTLDDICKINVVKFNYKQREVENADGKMVGLYEEDSPVLTHKHYGVIAQELQKIYPDLVIEGEDGYLGVNYVELVPLLIQSVQELSAKLDEAQKSNARRDDGTTEIADLENVLNTELFQNTPNPFTEVTTIACSVAESIKTAVLYVYDMNGKQIAEYPVDGRGNTSIIIEGSSLDAGMYLYSLIADGKIIDTKRMILTK